MTAVRDDYGPALWRAVAVLLAGLVAGVLTAAPAGAHAYLTGSDPEDEDTVTDELEMVVLEFNEDVDLPQIEVLDPDGESVVDGDAEDLGDVMEQPLAELTAHGTYTVEWRVVSQDDHPIDGEFTFEYDGPLPEDEPAEEEPAEDPDEPVEAPADEPADDDAEEPVEEPADEEPAEEELATEPAADTGEGGLPIGAIAAVVIIGLAAAAFFALRGRGADDAGSAEG